MLAAAGPLAAAPVAAVERRRLALVDDRPLAPGRASPSAAATGTWQWPRSRYTEPAAWRELAYAVALVTVVLVA